MSAKNDGGPAFPHQDSGDTGTRPGMSLREYYAGQALMGFCANPGVHQPNSYCGWSLVNITEEQLALVCVAYAESMIAAIARAEEEG